MRERERSASLEAPQRLSGCLLQVLSPDEDIVSLGDLSVCTAQPGWTVPKREQSELPPFSWQCRLMLWPWPCLWVLDSSRGHIYFWLVSSWWFCEADLLSSQSADTVSLEVLNVDKRSYVFIFHCSLQITWLALLTVECKRWWTVQLRKNSGLFLLRPGENSQFNRYSKLGPSGRELGWKGRCPLWNAQLEELEC